MNSYTIKFKGTRTVEATSQENAQDYFDDGYILDDLTIEDLEITEIEDNGEVDLND